MNNWWDKYFHWYQRNKIYDVYLEEPNDEYLVVVLKDGRRGKTKLGGYSDLSLCMQVAFINASEPIYEKTDYEKYLKPTLGTTRPDPVLASHTEKGFVPTLTQFKKRIRNEPILKFPRTKYLGKIIDNYIDDNGLWIMKMKCTRAFFKRIERDKIKGFSTCQFKLKK